MSLFTYGRDFPFFGLFLSKLFGRVVSLSGFGTFVSRFSLLETELGSCGTAYLVRGSFGRSSKKSFTCTCSILDFGWTLLFLIVSISFGKRRQMT